jgi:hypothetical protein
MTVVRRGESSPRFGTEEKPAETAWSAAFRETPLEPFQRVPNTQSNSKRTIMDTNTNQTANTPDSKDNVAFLEGERTRLKHEADAIQVRLDELRAENAGVGGKASSIIDNARKSKWLRVTKRVLGYTLAVGGVTLVGAYAYSRLRTAGVNVPDGDAIGATVASAVDAMTA